MPGGTPEIRGRALRRTGPPQSTGKREGREGRSLGKRLQPVPPEAPRWGAAEQEAGVPRGAEDLPPKARHPGAPERTRARAPGGADARPEEKRPPAPGPGADRLGSLLAAPKLRPHAERAAIGFGSRARILIGLGRRAGAPGECAQAREQGPRSPSCSPCSQDPRSKWGPAVASPGGPS